MWLAVTGYLSLQLSWLVVIFPWPNCDTYFISYTGPWAICVVAMIKPFPPCLSQNSLGSIVPPHVCLDVPCLTEGRLGMLTQSFWDPCFKMTSEAERQPAHVSFVPWNKKSCSTNVTVAVALQAFLYRQCLCKDLPTLLHQAHVHVSYAFPPGLRFLSLCCLCGCAGAFTCRAMWSKRSELEITLVFRFWFGLSSSVMLTVWWKNRNKQSSEHGGGWVALS